VVVQLVQLLVLHVVDGGAHEGAGGGDPIDEFLERHDPVR
jgi:hypothetical protein